MNRHQAIFQLQELSSHAKELVNEIENGDYDEDAKIEYGIMIRHLMEHLVRAWHFAYMNDEQIQALFSTDDYMKVSQSIPKFNEEQRLISPEESPLL